MGEQKRRAASVEAKLLKLDRQSTDPTVGAQRALATLANFFDAFIFIKEDGDDLANWPTGAIIGSGRGERGAIAAREWFTDFRRVSEQKFEFVIPDRMIVATSVVELFVNGHPVPTSEPGAYAAEVMKTVRAFLRLPGGGWRAVGPNSAIVEPHGAMN